MLVERFGGTVPGTMEELLTLPGVGRKTANLVLILAFKSRQNICVDTHVHRISNRLGWVRTRTPEETEQALYKATDEQWWPHINLYLVTWGQNVCRPVYPRCGTARCRDVAVGVVRREIVASVAGDSAGERVRSSRRRAALVLAAARRTRCAVPAQAAGAPVIVVETAKGTFEFETYPNEAPKTVAHIVALVSKRLLRRPARASRVPGFVVQFGDPQSRDLAKRDEWGRGAAASSGTPIGVAEMTKKRTHMRGAVGMAHHGRRRRRPTARSTSRSRRRPDLNGKYAVFGQVIDGADVPATLQVGDRDRDDVRAPLAAAFDTVAIVRSPASSG